MTVRTKYGAMTVQLTPAPLPKFVAQQMPQELWPVEHRVGYSEVLLQNGDLIRMHLFVDAMNWQEETASYVPSYRVVPEVVKRGWGGCESVEKGELS